MQQIYSAKSDSRKLSSKNVALILSLVCAVYGGCLSAQVVTISPTTTASNHADSFASYLRQGMQYARQGQQYANGLEQLRQMLTKIQSLGNNLSIAPKTLQPLSSSQQDQLVDQTCPGAPLGGVVSGAIGSLLGQSNQSITERQNLICREIVMLQVDEYNVTSKALQFLTAQQSTVQKISDIVNGISTFGESSSATSQTEQYLAQLQTAGDTWKQQVAADDAMIETLQNQQSMLGRVAMRGSSTVLGNVIQATTFAAAFH